MRPASLLVALLMAAALSGCLAPMGTEPGNPTGTDGQTTSGAPPTTGNTTTGTTTGNGTSPPPGNFTWGDPEDRTLRPGINMVHGNSLCTTSFLFAQGERVFMATAAHCVADGDGCDAGRKLPREEVELRLTDGSTAAAKVAYHSWTTMSRIAEADPNTCQGNDFALLELAAGDIGRAHPASLHFRAPTGLATSATPDIWGYGASSAKGGIEEAHPKQGRHIGMSFDGWQHHVYLATPGIPGDSGGHILTRDGKALGVASTITLYPTTGSNHYTDIARSLAYMQEHEGWAPALLTWNDFHASLIGG